MTGAALARPVSAGAAAAVRLGAGEGRRPEVPAGAPVLPLDQALDAAEQSGVRLCSLRGAAAGLDPFLKGFDHGFG